MDVRQRWWLAIACIVGASATVADDTLPPLHAREHALCESAADCETVDRVRFLGALALPAIKAHGMTLAGLSGLAWDADEGILYTISDQGAVFGLKPEFRNGQLSSVQLVSAAPLIDPKTGKPVRWLRSDAEGLELLNAGNGRKGDTELLISFEGEPRLARYRPDGKFITEIELPPALRSKSAYRYNRMLESVCHHPREGLLTAPEEPLAGDDKQHYLYRVRDGARWKLPTLHGGISAIECLPDGSVLLLERELQMALMRWRVILRKLTLPSGQTTENELKSEILAEIDSLRGLSLDNFEGMARHRDGRYFMVSDNNDNLLQQTLLVYFEINEK
jgi:hypothetical protein